MDYAVILSGEITLLLDAEDIIVRAGDVVVQRGTNHSWSNRGGEPCRVGFILLDTASTEGEAHA
ncbi:MAG: cupin domain-containing protein [Myxococcota bacterium]